MKAIALILTCEHAVNTIPAEFSASFEEVLSILDTHSAIDFGALSIANYLSATFNCALVKAKVSRLLIDCNRSLNHPNCFSEFSRPYSTEEKKQLIDNYYLPFRQKAEAMIQQKIAQGFQVWHLSMHSFTPLLNGIKRQTDLGLLYDPRRLNEKKLAKAWQQQLKQQSLLRVRLNYPYLGISNGFVCSLRKQFDEEHYCGLEVETNQSLVSDPANLGKVSELLALTLKTVLEVRSLSKNHKY